MEVAIVIPLFNGARWIRQTLQSVTSQSRPPKEVIVVDDCSTDGSPGIIREFSGVRLLHNQTKGANMARNEGFQQTSAPLVVFLDQDDIWQVRHLQFLVSILEANPECPAATADTCDFGSDSELHFPSSTLDPVVWDPWDYFPFHFLSTPSAMVIRRSALEMMGGWPTQYTGVADFYTLLRLSTTHPVIKNHSVTVARRRHTGSYSSVLLRENARNYIDYRMSAAADLLKHRLESHHKNHELSSKRLLILETIRDLVKTAHELNTAELAELARMLQERVSGESLVYTHLAYSYLYWFLYPAIHNDNLNRQQAIWHILLQYWPNVAEDIRYKILASIPDVDTFDVRKQTTSGKDL